MAVALVQWLPLPGLSMACAAALIAGVSFAPGRLRLLLKRTRWLIASLVLLFALATPGVYILPALGGYGPTAEGMWLGLEHLMRLLFVLATLSVLLQLTGVEGLVAGLHGVILPLSWLGLDRGRLSVRLMLVMQYVEKSPPGRHWRDWLESPGSKPAFGQICLHKTRFAPTDYAVLAGLTFGILALIGAVS
ncbi:MAG: energy-coupling factor transporter transmembrane protein EcfT [Rhodocyclaceae bacterium]|nr:energy-coupling factor transporter transmembrane protein EcfT [Rhodocyclaceae bacterium]